MAIKTTISNLINANLADTPLIVPSKHREVEAALLDNAYGNSIYDVNNNITTTVSVTNTVSAQYEYAISFLKQGRLVSVNGQIRNKTGGIISNRTWLTISNADFIQEEGKNVYINAFDISNGSSVRCLLRDSSFKLMSALSDGTSIFFNFNYFTKD